MRKYKNLQSPSGQFYVGGVAFEFTHDSQLGVGVYSTEDPDIIAFLDKTTQCWELVSDDKKTGLKKVD